LQLRGVAAGGALAIASIATATSARAQAVTFDTAHSIYTEAPSHSKMTVYTPGVQLQVQPWEWLQVRAGWEADVVSGASVATKAGPAYAGTHPGADVITSASVHDFRNSANGGFTIKNEGISLTAGYAYSAEHDYRSSSLNVAARTELFEHDTQLEIAYARNFDSVCDRVQSVTAAPTQFVALETSTGCFASDPLRRTQSIAIDGLQGSWSQAWTPVFATQLVYTAQIVNGFQSDPYRSVLLADGVKAQEHEPENRAREALALRGNYFIKPLKAAVRVGVRGYWDTWDVKGFTGEAELEKYLGEPLRLTARARVYRQSGAIFWSDDYTGGDRPLGPKGQYWTGDKELSPFTSILIGLRAIYTISPNQRLLGVISGLKFGASADAIQFDYSEFTYAGEPITKAQAYVGTLDFVALF
jgi:hypothetical protein